MRKVKCPVCEKTKRPYGLPRTDKPRPGHTQLEYEIGTYEYTCDACGTVLYIRMDYVLDMAPVDILEVWASDGTTGEVVDEKRGSSKRTAVEYKRVSEDDVTRPVKKP